MKGYRGIYTTKGSSKKEACKKREREHWLKEVFD